MPSRLTTTTTTTTSLSKCGSNRPVDAGRAGFGRNGNPQSRTVVVRQVGRGRATPIFSDPGWVQALVREMRMPHAAMAWGPRSRLGRTRHTCQNETSITLNDAAARAALRRCLPGGRHAPHHQRSRPYVHGCGCTRHTPGCVQFSYRGSARAPETLCTRWQSGCDGDPQGGGSDSSSRHAQHRKRQRPAAMAAAVSMAPTPHMIVAHIVEARGLPGLYVASVPARPRRRPV